MAIIPIVDRSIGAIRKFSGGNSMRRKWYDYHSLGTVKIEDDFVGDSIDARWDSDANGAASAAAALVANAPGGAARLTTGTDDDGYSSIDFDQLNFKGDLNAVIAVRLKLSAVTTVKVEVGFTDVGTDAGAVNVLATPTYTAGDAALWILDRDDTANWQAVGVKAGTGITKLEPGTPPVAATYETFVVALQGDAVKYLRFNATDDEVYESAWQNNGIEGGTALTPWVFVQARAVSASRDCDVDYVSIWQSRT